MAFNEFETDTSKLFLDAVNVLLQVINERPIENEEDLDAIEEARFATSVLIETKKEVLSNGWDFNTDVDYSLPADDSGYITVPFNMLDLYSSDGDLISRDWRLYSKSNQSPVFDEAQKVTIIWDVAFNSLTHPIRNFITIKACRKFQARQIMDTQIYAYTQEDEGLAEIIAKRSDGRTSQDNTCDSTYGNNYLVSGTL